MPVLPMGGVADLTIDPWEMKVIVGSGAGRACQKVSLVESFGERVRLRYHVYHFLESCIFSARSYRFVKFLRVNGFQVWYANS